MISPVKIQVRFTDLDILGHVNNNIYFSYFEMARVHYFKQLLGADWNWRKYTVVLAKNEIEYLKPVFLNHEPEVFMHCEHIGTKSFSLLYEIKVNGIIFAKGKSVMVAFDGENNISMEIHPEMLAGLRQIKL